MAFNNLPPQAYTRDVLMAAYDWLQSQPASIRELAVGPDALVSLFMQARRRVNAGATGTVQNAPAATSTPFPISVQAPMTTASADAFKQDLKSLAADLKQFEDPKAAAPAAVATTYIAPMPAYTPPPPPAPTFTAPTPYTPPPAVQTANPTIKPETENASPQLDARTRQVLSEVKQKLNVSSEAEALRLLVAIGYEKIRDILPKN